MTSCAGWSHDNTNIILFSERISEVDFVHVTTPVHLWRLDHVTEARRRRKAVYLGQANEVVIT